LHAHRRWQRAGPGLTRCRQQAARESSEEVRLLLLRLLAALLDRCHQVRLLPAPARVCRQRRVIVKVRGIYMHAQRTARERERAEQGQALAAFGGLAAALLGAACADAAPAVARAACEAAAAWAAAAGARLRPVSPGLAAAVLPLATHPHWQVLH